MAARFGFSEDTVRLAAALRPALASRGVPERIYVDNGSAFAGSWLLRACASLGIKLVHSAPGRPPLTGQCLRDLAVFLADVTGKLGWLCGVCGRRVALTGAGQIPLLMSHA